MQKQQEIYPLSDTVKAEARFRVKTEFCLEVAISEQFQPNSANVKKNIISRLWNLRVGLAWLPACRFLF